MCSTETNSLAWMQLEIIELENPFRKTEQVCLNIFSLLCCTAAVVRRELFVQDSAQLCIYSGILNAVQT